VLRLIAWIPPIIPIGVAVVAFLVGFINGMNWSDNPAIAAEKMATWTRLSTLARAMVALAIGSAAARRVVSGRTTPRRMTLNLLAIPGGLVVVWGVYIWLDHRWDAPGSLGGPIGLVVAAAGGVIVAAVVLARQRV
jgi:hypothetical protein